MRLQNVTRRKETLSRYELSLQDRKEELRNREGVVGEVELKIVVICCCFSWEGKSIVK